MSWTKSVWKSAAEPARYNVLCTSAEDQWHSTAQQEGGHIGSLRSTRQTLAHQKQFLGKMERSFELIKD